MVVSMVLKVRAIFLPAKLALLADEEFLIQWQK